MADGRSRYPIRGTQHNLDYYPDYVESVPCLFGPIGPPRSVAVELLDLDSGSSLFQLGLDLFSFFLGDAFLDGCGSGLNQLFGLTQAQGSDLTDGFNDVDLVGTDVLQADLELGLLAGVGVRSALGRC
jgi:hypothetical protein